MGCCSHDQSHKKGHHNHHGNSCCCEKSSCCCNSNCHCCAEESCEYEDEESCKGTKLLELADEAWMELLKEKIKAHILKTDTKLDELAKIVAEANHKRWSHKMKQDKCDSEFDQCCDEYKDQLCKLFSSCGPDSCKTEQKGK
jgi:hypothetical protein